MSRIGLGLSLGRVLAIGLLLRAGLDASGVSSALVVFVALAAATDCAGQEGWRATQAAAEKGTLEPW